MRRLRGQRFGRGRTVPAGPAGTSSIINLAIDQDAAGRFVAVWYSSSFDRLEVSVSRDGRRWTPSRVLVTGVDLAFDIEVALGPDGRGAVAREETDRIGIGRVSVPGLLKQARKSAAGSRVHSRLVPWEAWSR